MSKAAKKQTKSLLKLKPFIDKLRKISLYKWFLTAFCVGSLLFVMITPPGQNPDEAAHLYRTWQFSRLNLRSDKVIADNGGLEYGGYISNSLKDVLEDAHSDVKQQPGFRWNNISFEGKSTQPIDNSDTTYIPFNNTAVYSPAAYLPGIIAIWLGNLLQLPAIAVFYLVRLAFLAAAAILVYLAIRLAPRWKWAFATVALLPSTLSIAGSISADPVVIGSAFVFIAYTLRLALQDKILSTKQLVILGVLLSTVVLAKVSYCPVALLLLAIPLLNPYTRNRKTILRLAAVLVISALIATAWLYLVRDVPIRPLKDSGINKSFILHNPLSFLVVLINSIFYNGPIDLAGVVGHFGWLMSPMSDLFVFVGIAVIILSAFVGSGKTSLTSSGKSVLWWNLLMMAVVATTYVVISLSLYLYWSDDYSAIISGLQARYLLPVLPALLLALSTLGTLSNQKRLKAVIITLLCIVYVAGLATAFSGYYITIPTSMA